LDTGALKVITVAVVLDFRYLWMLLLSLLFECVPASKEARDPVLHCAEAIPYDFLEWEADLSTKLSFWDAKPRAVVLTPHGHPLGRQVASPFKERYRRLLDVGLSCACVGREGEVIWACRFEDGRLASCGGKAEFVRARDPCWSVGLSVKVMAGPFDHSEPHSKNRRIQFIVETLKREIRAHALDRSP
jgi:hypothetical protein